jgi:hypothetical protein
VKRRAAAILAAAVVVVRTHVPQIRHLAHEKLRRVSSPPGLHNSSLAKKENPRTVRNDGVGGLSLGPPTESLMNQGLGPVEDENMENVRFSPRK